MYPLADTKAEGMRRQGCQIGPMMRFGNSKNEATAVPPLRRKTRFAKPKVNFFGNKSANRSEKNARN